MGKSGVSDFFILGNKSAGKIALYKCDGTTYTELAADSSTITTATMHKIDVKVESWGSNATITVYVDGSQIISFNGDPRGSANITNLDRVVIRGSTSYYLSEIIVADEDTRLMSLKTLAPDSNGDTNEWDNSYTAIDETELSDFDTVYTSTADETFTCNLTGMPAGDFICKGVKVAARATDGIGGLGMQLGVKTNSTLDLSDTISLGGYWETQERLYQNNPITSNRFSGAEIDALQSAFVSKSTA
jgi:hypothetical protein